MVATALRQRTQLDGLPSSKTFTRSVGSGLFRTTVGKLASPSKAHFIRVGTPGSTTILTGALFKSSLREWSLPRATTEYSPGLEKNLLGLSNLREQDRVRVRTC
eukprot:5024438-Prymnesium_polylepis.3